MSELDELMTMMTKSATKTVTRSDKAKKAYLPNKAQQRVLWVAGYTPVDQDENRLINLVAARTGRVFRTSYYKSMRQGAGRSPEPRMGRGLVNWLEEGDRLTLATDGTTVFAWKEDSRPQRSGVDNDDLEEQEPNSGGLGAVDISRLLARVRELGDKANQREIQSTAFERNPSVRDFVRRRSEGQCEMPGCGWTGFEKADGDPYIEVHHIRPLGSAGDDSIDNAAGVCPNCHRRAHYGKNREALRQLLLRAVKAANAAYR